MNIYPNWKNWLVVIVIALGIIFALPNLFGEDPAIQFKAKNNIEIVELDANATQDESSIGLENTVSGVADQVRAVLKAADIEPREIENKNGELIIRMASVEDQLKAIDVIRPNFKDGYNAALLHLQPVLPTG